MCPPDCPETGKRSYASRGRALACMVPHLHARSGWKPPHRVYRCPHCGWWHLTKQPLITDPISRQKRAAWRTRRHHDATRE